MILTVLKWTEAYIPVLQPQLSVTRHQLDKWRSKFSMNVMTQSLCTGRDRSAAETHRHDSLASEAGRVALLKLACQDDDYDTHF